MVPHQLLHALRPEPLSISTPSGAGAGAGPSEMTSAAGAGAAASASASCSDRSLMGRAWAAGAGRGAGAPVGAGPVGCSAACQLQPARAPARCSGSRSCARGFAAALSALPMTPPAQRGASPRRWRGCRPRRAAQTGRGCAARYRCGLVGGAGRVGSHGSALAYGSMALPRAGPGSVQKGQPRSELVRLAAAAAG